MNKRFILLLDVCDPPVEDPCAVASPPRLSGCCFNTSSSKSTNQAQSTSNPVVNQQGLDMLTQNAQAAPGNIANALQPFGGQLGAGLSSNQQQAIGAAPGMLTAGQPALNSATQAAGGLLGYQAPQVGASLASPGLMGQAPQSGAPNSVNADNISGLMSQFMSPYTQDVVNATNAQINQQRQQAIMGNSQAATEAGAFGGNRLGVQNALTNQLYDRDTAQTDAQLNQAGFNTALQGATSQAGNQLAAGVTNANNQLANNQFNTGLLANTAQFNAQNQQQSNLTNAGALNSANQFNVNSGLASAGVQQTAANSMANMSGQQQQQFGNYVNSLLSTGAVDQATVQNNLSAIYNAYLQQQQAQLQGQGLLNQSVGLVPYSLGQSSQGTSSGTNNSSSFGFQLPMPGK